MSSDTVCSTHLCCVCATKGKHCFRKTVSVKIWLWQMFMFISPTCVLQTWTTLSRWEVHKCRNSPVKNIRNKRSLNTFVFLAPCFRQTRGLRESELFFNFELPIWNCVLKCRNCVPRKENAFSLDQHTICDFRTLAAKCLATKTVQWQTPQETLVDWTDQRAAERSIAQYCAPTPHTPTKMWQIVVACDSVFRKLPFPPDAPHHYDDPHQHYK